MLVMLIKILIGKLLLFGESKKVIFVLNQSFRSGTQMQIEEAQRLIQEKAGVAPPPPSNQTNPSMHQYGDVSAT